MCLIALSIQALRSAILCPARWAFPITQSHKGAIHIVEAARPGLPDYVYGKLFTLLIPDL